MPLPFLGALSGSYIKDRTQGENNMVIKGINTNEEIAKLESGQLRDFVMRVRKARKDVEAEGIQIPLNRVEMHVNFQEGTCEATYLSPNSFLNMTHKISDLEAFSEEVKDVFRIIAERE